MIIETKFRWPFGMSAGIYNTYLKGNANLWFGAWSKFIISSHFKEDTFL